MTHPETVTEKSLAPSSTFCNNFIIQKCLCVKGLNAARGTAVYACRYYELAHYRLTKANKIGGNFTDKIHQNTLG